jgi:hypothetical protein
MCATHRDPNQHRYGHGDHYADPHGHSDANTNQHANRDGIPAQPS